MAEPRTIFLDGNIEDRTSFSIVNRHLADGLRRRGYRVTEFPRAACPGFRHPADVPDIYAFQGFPHDARNAPGRLNVMIFTWEYHALERAQRLVMERVNRYFDLLLVPSRFVARVCRREGVRVPVEVCPHGTDHKEFHPSAPAEPLPTRKVFRFLNLGGAGDRKGIDVLLRAYTREFSADEDVSLVVKVRGYELQRPWAEQLLARIPPGAPEILYIDRDAASVSGFYTAADAGVFPHRGEGFGMPVLECLTSGRPVIVTRGTGPMDFCTPDNAWFIRARRRFSKGRDWLEPDVGHLRKLMREVYENRASLAAQREAVRRTVKGFTWEKAVETLDRQLRQAWEGRQIPAAPVHRAKRPAVVYSFAKRGRISWGKCVSKIDGYLARRYVPYERVPSVGGPARITPDLVVGQSEYCLEEFLRGGRRNPEVRRVLHLEQTALEYAVETTNRERRSCGLEPIEKPPIEFWRNKMECDLADRIVVCSNSAARYFTRAGYPSAKIRVLPWGFEARECVVRAGRGPLRFLFAATDPFRKGVRVLFEAWDRLRPAGAELWCYVNEEALRSELLVKYLVRNSGIHVYPLIPHRRFLEVCLQAHCHVLPSFVDVFSLTVADGMALGSPAIVSDETGCSQFIRHEENGYIVKTGSVTELARGIEWFCERPRRIGQLGVEAFETARARPWTRFRDEFLEFTDSCLPGRDPL